MTNSLIAKAELISSHDFITQDMVCKKLGIQPGSAANLLTLWNSTGILRRISPGVYLSSAAVDSSNELIQAQLSNLKQRVDDKFVLVGASAWERAGWCKSSVLHVAIASRPSRRMPKMLDCMLHPVGIKQSVHLLKNASIDERTGMFFLKPVHQMLWWMEPSCPVPMPHSDDINWSAVLDRVDLRETMAAQWSEFSNMDSVDVRILYDMIRMDRLTNSWSGPAELEEDTEEEEGEEQNSMAPAAG